eukprot:1223380-Pleurochrysis_carterae.AAC.1
MERSKAKEAFEGLFSSGAERAREGAWLEKVTDVREYDVPYHHRVAIDTQRRVGLWYTVSDGRQQLSKERTHSQ